MQRWETRGVQLTISGDAAPQADEVISAELTYGSAGTCQGGTLRTVGAAARGRDTEWVLSLDGAPVFRGIPDSVSDTPGQLAQVSLLPPHRRWMDALIAQEPGHAVPEGSSLYETVGTAISRSLESNPNADYGVKPDGTEVRAELTTGDMYALDENAFDLRYIGVAFPDAVTDVLFDPGEGWKKYTWRRDAPPYTLRKTATATANPAIIEQSEPLNVIRDASEVPPVVTGSVTHRFNNIIEADNVERRYMEQDSTKTEILSDIGVFAFASPADTDERRYKALSIRCPFFVGAMAPYPEPSDFVFAPVTVDGVATTDPPGTVRINGVVQPNKVNTTLAPMDSNADLSTVRSAVNTQSSVVNALVSTQDASTTAIGQLANNTAILAEQLNQLTLATTGNNSAVSQLSDQIRGVASGLNSVGQQVAGGPAPLTQRGTPKNGVLKLGVSLISLDSAGVETVLNTVLHAFKETDVGLELAFEFKVEKIASGSRFKLRYELTEQDTGMSIRLTLRPIEVRAIYDTPNLPALVMPKGWELPFRTEPRFELSLPGWHTPPLRITGLPGGLSQMAAGSTVTWTRDTCSTRITTAAWGYG